MIALVRLVHPAPTVAVVSMVAALAAILSAQGGLEPLGPRVMLTILSVTGSQILTGALNDWADRGRDAIAQRAKPIPSGQVAPATALMVVGGGAAIQLVSSLPLGAAALLLGIAAVASSTAYNIGLSRTVASFVPYLVSFGLLPLWVAAGVGVPLERVAVAPLLIGPFAVAAHLANALRDFDADADLGSGNLAQRLGRSRAFWLAWSVALGVGVGAGIGLTLGGGLGLASLVLGIGGMLAVAQGAGGAHRLWIGMLVAAVCWTSAWALATG